MMQLALGGGSKLRIVRRSQKTEFVSRDAVLTPLPHVESLAEIFLRQLHSKPQTQPEADTDVDHHVEGHTYGG